MRNNQNLFKQQTSTHAHIPIQHFEQLIVLNPASSSSKTEKVTTRCTLETTKYLLKERCDPNEKKPNLSLSCQNHVRDKACLHHDLYALFEGLCRVLYRFEPLPHAVYVKLHRDTSAHGAAAPSFCCQPHLQARGQFLAKILQGAVLQHMGFLSTNRKTT